ncbi:MAG: hypothetical protein WAU58_11205 [Terriglobales bacterium]
MPVWRPVFLAAFVFAAICVLSTAAACESDQGAAERVLGSQWKHLSQRAGMVFAGTVLSERIPTARTDRGVPFIPLRFRVDRAIAGVQPGQVLTIHEWTGAASLHRLMRRGEHVLLFLYPPSRLGLTSPVGGPRGQLRLDATGRNVAEQRPVVAASTQDAVRPNSRSGSDSANGTRVARTPATLDQLERAIRAAREE